MKLKKLILQIADLTKSDVNNVSDEIEKILSNNNLLDDNISREWIETFFEEIINRIPTDEKSFKDHAYIDNFYYLITQLVYYKIYNAEAINYGEDMEINSDEIQVYVYISWLDNYYSIELL